MQSEILFVQPVAALPWMRGKQEEKKQKNKAREMQPTVRHFIGEHKFEYN